MSSSRLSILALLASTALLHAGPAADLRKSFQNPPDDCPHHDALVVVRPGRHQGRTRKRDAHDESRRHRRLRGPTCLSARTRRPDCPFQEPPLHVRRVSRNGPVHQRESPRTRAAHGYDALQRLALRRTLCDRGPRLHHIAHRTRRSSNPATHPSPCRP